MKKLTYLVWLGLSAIVCYSCNQDDVQTPETETIPIIYSDVHDPAQLIEIDGDLFLFASAVEWSIYEGNHNWQLRGDNIYENGNPPWYSGTSLWAPSVFKAGTDDFRLYHSAVINEDNHQSRIGFATIHASSGALSFTPSPDFVVESENMNQPFAIDPAVFRDKDDRIWLVYGSHTEGIWMAELDEQTGLLKNEPEDKTWAASDSRFTEIANYGGALSENNIEAAYIYNHPDNPYYYLFVNWDVCCSGVNSTYHIRVGRSASPTGPFLDKAGVDLKLGGGTVFADANGQILGDDRFIGPGHAGIYRHKDGRYYFTHHFYDAQNAGQPSLAIWNLAWENGWPVLNTALEVDL